MENSIQHDRPFSKQRFGSGLKSVWQVLLLILVFLLMSLPLFTTFNELLTRIAEVTGVYGLLAQHVVPFLTRAVSVILMPLGIDVKTTVSHLFIEPPGGSRTGVYFSWNCLGWQSGILLILTFLTGLTGNHPILSKIETVLLGLSGTFLINLLRIAVVVVTAYYFGTFPATLVHDYGGTMFTMLWFFFYWWFAYSFILETN